MSTRFRVRGYSANVTIYGAGRGNPLRVYVDGYQGEALPALYALRDTIETALAYAEEEAAREHLPPSPEELARFDKPERTCATEGCLERTRNVWCSGCVAVQES